jgi:hypothetical protein
VVAWTEWAESLDRICRSYTRPAGACAMTTDAELCFLENYARYSYTGQGRIVDLGCWLGATSLCLARGLAQNAQHRYPRPVEAIDRFIWEDWMDPIAQLVGVPKRYQVGDDFIADVRAILAPFAQYVEVRRRDLARPEPYHSSVEFLFIDAMKSWDLANAIPRSFFANLIPGRSLVVQQDFGYFSPIVATNHLLMWHLRDHFECVHCVPGSCSAVFFHTRPVAIGELPVLSPQSVTPETIDLAWQYSLGCVPAEFAPALHLCKLLFLIELGHSGAAEAIAAQLLAEGIPLAAAGLDGAAQMIANQAVAARDNERWARLADLVGTLRSRAAW